MTILYYIWNRLQLDLDVYAGWKPHRVEQLCGGGVDVDDPLVSALFELLAESGYEGWMIVEAEQDPAIADPLEYAIKARKYIKKTAGI